MAINTDILDAEQMTRAEEVFAALLTDEGLDCTPGTAVRELVVRPAAVLMAHLEAYKRSLLASLDLAAVAAGEIEGDDGVIDALASTFRVFRRSGTASRGSVILRLASDAMTYVGPSYRFYAGDHPLLFSPTHVGVADMTGLADSADAAYVPIRPRGDEWYMVVPVTCPSGESFAAGTEVQFTGGVGNVLGVSVYSPVTGGGKTETNRDLARRVLYGVAPGVLSTPLQLRGGFGDEFGIPPHRVAVFGTGSPAQRRDPEGKGGVVDVAVAPSGDCAVGHLLFEAVGTGGDYVGTLADAAGVCEITAVYAGDSPVKDFQVEWKAAPSGLHAATDGSARYTSLQTAVITFSLPGASGPLSCEAVVRHVPDIAAMQTWLDSSDRRAPGQDTLVRAPAPCFLSLSVTVTGGELPEESVRERIVRHLNDLPVGRGRVSAQDLADALQGTGTSLVYPVMFSGRLVLPSGSRMISSPDGSLAVPSLPGVDPAEVVFYASAEGVRVSRA